MHELPHLSFLAPEVEKGVMVVDEIKMDHQQLAAPFKSSRFIVYPGQTSPLDIHNVKECWFVAAGNGVVTYDGKQNTTIKQGDVLYYEPQKSHEVYNNGTENLLIFSVWWNP